MDKVTQENAANAEQSAAASEEMQAQAESLLSGIAELRGVVGGSASSPAEVPPPAPAPRAPLMRPTVVAKAHAPARRASGERAPAAVLPLTDDEAKEHKGDFSRF